MNFIKTNIILFLFCCLFIFSSCREILTPNNNQEENNDLNNPVESITPNSYTFEISAENNSSSFVNVIPVLQNPDLSLALNNYGSGTVHITLVNSKQATVYNRIFGSGFPGSTVNLGGIVPSQLILDFNNFSGDFSLNLNGNP